MMNPYMRGFGLALLLVAGLAARPGCAQAQQTTGEGPYHSVPIASIDNLLELTLENSTDQAIEDVTISVGGLPSWVSFGQTEMTVQRVEPGRQVPVAFTFSVSGEAALRDTASVRLAASSGQGALWTTTIRLQVGPPEEFKLFPNFPNPFTEGTTIRYNLPDRMQVRVRVYDLLGRRVATLADEPQEAGQYDLRWETARVASGMYICRIIAEGQGGQSFVEQQKMMLVR